MLRAYGQVGVKPRSVGPSKQLLNTILLTCKQPKADTRQANCKLQTAGLEILENWTVDLKGLGNSD